MPKSAPAKATLTSPTPPPAVRLRAFCGPSEVGAGRDPTATSQAGRRPRAWTTTERSRVGSIDGAKIARRRAPANQTSTSTAEFQP
ncbi:unnamed protein product [Ectocarpus sp. 6 AP-2014]